MYFRSLYVCKVWTVRSLCRFFRWSWRLRRKWSPLKSWWLTLVWCFRALIMQYPFQYVTSNYIKRQSAHSSTSIVVMDCNKLRSSSDAPQWYTTLWLEALVMHHSALYGWKQMADVTWEGGVLFLCENICVSVPLMAPQSRSIPLSLCSLCK